MEHSRTLFNRRAPVSHSKRILYMSHATDDLRPPVPRCVGTCTRVVYTVDIWKIPDSGAYEPWKLLYVLIAQYRHCPATQGTCVGQNSNRLLVSLACMQQV